MRTIAEIQNPDCKISIFAWNQKYLIKFEQNGLEQVYKVSEFDVMGDEGVKKILTDEFIKQALKRFDDMREDLNEALNKGR
ncbi:MAG: hypothetical protein K8I03_04020 [Ignavibacteria bacterium]|nr:hypothetical protein [Ignavibacteria bacterium]